MKNSGRMISAFLHICGGNTGSILFLSAFLLFACKVSDAAQWVWWTRGNDLLDYDNKIFQTDGSGKAITNENGEALFSERVVETGTSDVTQSTNKLDAATGFRTQNAVDFGYNTTDKAVNLIFGYYNSAYPGVSEEPNYVVDVNSDLYLNRIGFANNAVNSKYPTIITTSTNSTIYMGKENAGDGFCYRVWNNATVEQGGGAKNVFDVNFDITPMYSSTVSNKATNGSSGGAIFRLGSNSMTFGSAENNREIFINDGGSGGYNFIYMSQCDGQKQVADIYSTITSQHSGVLYFYAGTAENKCIVNFRGNGNNILVNTVFDCGVFNLMKSDGASAATTQLSLRYDTIVNVMSEGNLNYLSDLFAGTSYNGVSGTINLCGTSIRLPWVYMNSTSAGDRRINIDFGMTRSGMTAEEMSAQGISVSDISGKSSAQTLVMGKIDGIGEDYVSTSYVEIFNFYSGDFGGDRIIMESGIEIDTSDISKNALRIDVSNYQAILDDFYGIGAYDLEYGNNSEYGYWLESSIISDGEFAGMTEIDLVFNDAVQNLFSQIPEPSSIAFLFGLFALGFVLRRGK